MSYGKRLLGDCLELLPTLPLDSIDSIVTDPPYGLSFMGKGWDHGIPGVPFWEAALRVVKPGAFMLAFGGTRTHHRLMVAIEDAGWEIRDVIMWVYGSGFPKSLDVSKAIDKAAGVKREIVGSKVGLPGYSLKHQGVGGVLAGRADGSLDDSEGECRITAPATDAARQWEGFGTSLKPAWEPIIVARKPLVGTVAANVLKYGTGGMNIDGCRVGTDESISNHSRSAESAISKGKYGDSKEQETHQTAGQTLGRWPANLIHDGSDEVVGLFPNTKSGKDINPAKTSSSGFTGNGIRTEDVNYGDKGSAARFFYCAKSSRSERGEGNTHPTVKPIALIEYCCKLVTQPGGTVLDPFAGSFSTSIAAINLGMKYICIERDPTYFEIGRQRIAKHIGELFNHEEKT